MRIPTVLGRLLVVLTLALGLAACGDDDGSTSTTTADGDTTTTLEADDGSTTTSTDDGEGDGDGEAPAVETAVSVYFLGEGDKIRVGHVRMIDDIGVAAAALESLFEGPTADDEALGLSTTIPEGTTLRSIDLAGGIATVDLSGEFTSGGGSLSMQARLAQVVYTVTQFPTVESVELLVEGSPLETLGGEGITIDGPLTRADFQFDGTYEWLEPMVLVESPRPGETVQRDEILLVGGWANTFEAAVYVEILDAAGNVVVPETYTMASAGSGTTGMFELPVELPEDAPADLVVQAYDLSAEDGSRVGVTEVPFRVG